MKEIRSRESAAWPDKGGTMLRFQPRIWVLAFVAPLLLGGTAEAARRSRPAGPVLATTTQRPAAPDAYGVTAYTITSLSDLSFTTFDSTQTFDANIDDYFRYITSAGGGSFVAGAVIPAGAVIDFIGLSSCDPVGLSFVVAVGEMSDDGTLSLIGFVPSNGPCGTQYNAVPLAYPILGNAGRTIQVEVAQQPTAPVDGSARFGSVEIWWHREVSPSPLVATFADVPTDHPFFQFIEALAASGITGGCGAGNYCPDNPLTRGQMAVFLAKALGLHWPGNPVE
jgi:S-layer family protein